MLNANGGLKDGVPALELCSHTEVYVIEQDLKFFVHPTEFNPLDSRNHVQSSGDRRDVVDARILHPGGGDV